MEDSTKIQPKDYSMLIDDDNQNHAIIAALKIDKIEIINVKVEDEWRDDHCDCIGVTVILSDKSTYQYSDWWLSKEGYKMYIKAESGNKKAIKELKEHILSNEE